MDGMVRRYIWIEVTRSVISTPAAAYVYRLVLVRPPLGPPVLRSEASSWLANPQKETGERAL